LLFLEKLIDIFFCPDKVYYVSLCFDISRISVTIAVPPMAIRGGT